MSKALKDFESLCAAWCWIICAYSGKSFRKWDSSIIYGKAYWITVWVSVNQAYGIWRPPSAYQIYHSKTCFRCLCALLHQICFPASYLLEMVEGRVEKQERKSWGKSVGSVWHMNNLQHVGSPINFSHSNLLK